ncbi:MAG: winged helix-turn-helix transcriptional regulator [Actinomycetes bacterium]
MSEPAALAWSADTCTIARALDVIGDRWSLLVLREVFQGIRRFDHLTVRTAIPRQVLTDRLERLVAAGVLRKEPYQEPGQRRRNEYRLTDMGLDLYPVFMTLQKWGDAYLGGPEGPPQEFIHRDCGQRLDVVLRCEAGHEVEDSRQVSARLGPGARRRTAS